MKYYAVEPALGQRTGRNAGGETEEYLLDLTKQYHNLLGFQKGKQKQNFYWDFNVVAMDDENKTTRYYLQDELGSPLRVLYRNGNGDMYGYDEFGKDLFDLNRQQNAVKKYSRQGANQPFGYTGYRYDYISGTYFAQAREYKTYGGRFISRDLNKYMTLGDISSHNLCVYCKNSPLNYLDASGNEDIVVSGGIDDEAKFDYTFIEPALKKINNDIGGYSR